MSLLANKVGRLLVEKAAHVCVCMCVSGNQGMG